MKPNRILASFVAAFLLAATCAIPQAEACTRAVYIGEDGIMITGRSMDWKENMQTDLWIFPRGVERNGGAGPDSPTWTSKYGSVIASAYNIASADGMNEKGLVANLLYLAESEYGDDTQDPPMAISFWAQYVLDNFATVDEAVTHLEEHPLRIVTADLPNGSPATLHLSVSDPSGDSAIFEYVDGKLVVHHGKQYNVMTNSPVYSQQIALNDYWKTVDGLKFLPGTNRAADRYVRASFLMDAVTKKLAKNYIADVPNQTYANQAVAQTLSVIRGVSVPLGITTPDQPNIASTIWRTAADQKNLVYFFDSATTPNTFWVRLSEIDFSKDAGFRKLPIAGGKYYGGDATSHFEKAKPFKFMTVDPGS